MSTGLPSTDVDGVLIVNEAMPNGARNGNGRGAGRLTGNSMDADTWNRFVDETAGASEGEFVRPPQGEFEKREPFA